MKFLQTKIQSISRRLGLAAAIMAIVGSLGVGTAAIAGAGVASAQSSTPQKSSDCSKWRSYGFSSRASCITFVANNSVNNGYGGNGGGGETGGSIGRLVRAIVDSVIRVIRAIFAMIF